MRRDRAQPIRQVDDAPAAVPNGRDGWRLRARAKLPQLGCVLKLPAPPSLLLLFPAPGMGGGVFFVCFVRFRSWLFWSNLAFSRRISANIYPTLFSSNFVTEMSEQVLRGVNLPLENCAGVLGDKVVGFVVESGLQVVRRKG